MVNTSPTTATPHTLRGDSLVLGYGKSAEVIHRVDLAVQPGTVTVLVGPNGSGKSTLLRSLARLHPVTDGDIQLDDRSVSALSSREFARQVTLFSQFRLPRTDSPSATWSASDATPTGSASPDCPPRTTNSSTTVWTSRA